VIIEKRKLIRFIINVRIVDRETEQRLGYSANMHTEGMLITSTQPLPLQQLLQIKLVHIRKDDTLVEIPLDVIGLWSGPSRNPDFLQTGCKFVNPGAEQVRAIESVIRELAV
jgi:hypothetical protein